MTTNTNTTSGAADLASRLRNACTSVRSKSYPLADLIPLMQQAADALASAPAQPDLITIRKPTTRAEMMWLLKLAHLVISDVNKTLDDAFAPAQPAAEASRFGSPELQAMIIARCVEKDQADSVPKAQFDDPKVQAVYAILCDEAKPAEGEHWEGFTARRIVDALAADSVLEDAARLDFIERHPEMSLRHRKGRWAFLGFTNYEYDLHQSLRDAVDAAMNKGANHG